MFIILVARRFGKICLSYNFYNSRRQEAESNSFLSFLQIKKILSLHSSKFRAIRVRQDLFFFLYQ